jgi:Icc-related predicted phosphoesterase
MRLVLISDTHEDKPELPDGDVLIHCGDILGWGDQFEFIDFINWFKAQPHKHKIVIAGNHDILLDDPATKVWAKSLLEKAGITYLQNTHTEIEGKVFYGSPWTPKFGEWVFMLPRFLMHAVYYNVPDKVDVLITHGPPAGILDKTLYNGNVGCEATLEVVLRLKPKVHAFGHIHEAKGIFHTPDTVFINAARKSQFIDI